MNLTKEQIDAACSRAWDAGCEHSDKVCKQIYEGTIASVVVDGERYESSSYGTGFGYHDEPSMSAQCYSFTYHDGVTGLDIEVEVYGDS
jgi:hypothetical protein